MAVSMQIQWLQKVINELKIVSRLIFFLETGPQVLHNLSVSHSLLDQRLCWNKRYTSLRWDRQSDVQGAYHPKRQVHVQYRTIDILLNMQLSSTVNCY